jgi:hypothetical protein
VAAFDCDVAERVARWPLREMLLALLDRMRDRASEVYGDQVMIYTLRAPHLKSPEAPPKVPEILK